MDEPHSHDDILPRDLLIQEQIKHSLNRWINTGLN